MPEHTAGTAPRLRVLVRRRRLVGTLLVVALAGFLATTYRPHGAFGLAPRERVSGAATTVLLADLGRSPAVDTDAAAAIDLLAARARLLAALAMEPVIVDGLAAAVGAPPGAVTADPPPGPGAVAGPARATAYRVRAEAPVLDGGANPLIRIDTRAPTADAATRLASATSVALSARVQAVGRAQGTPPERLVRLTVLTPATGRTVRAGPSTVLHAAAAVAALLLACGLIVAGDGLRARRPAPVVVAAAP